MPVYDKAILNYKKAARLDPDNPSLYYNMGILLYETDKTSSELSDKISNDLKKRGMKFVGTTIIYSYLQAIGILYSHDKNCHMYKKS